MRHAFGTQTALAERLSAPCRSPYDLLAPVRALKKELGLTPNDLAVLTALISFLPRDGRDKPGQQGGLLTIVFPSNTALSERTNGLDERTLRRCLGRLSASGLIERRNSANGKRFPLRYNGVIRDAFGFDLQPLIEQYTSLAARAAKVAEENERLRSLKAEALALRAAVMQRTDLGQDEMSGLETMRNLLRRATLTVETVLRLIRDLRKLAADAKTGYGEHAASERSNMAEEAQKHSRELLSTEPGHLSATNGQNDRHIESIKIELKKNEREGEQLPREKHDAAPSMNRDPKTMAWDDFRHVADFFPDAPRDAEALTRILLELGKLLRISHDRLIRGLNRAGAGRILLAFDYLIARAEVIKEPNAYFEKMLST